MVPPRSTMKVVAGSVSLLGRIAKSTGSENPVIGELRVPLKEGSLGRVVAISVVLVMLDRSVFTGAEESETLTLSDEQLAKTISAPMTP
jgi:hypothetical protein